MNELDPYAPPTATLPEEPRTVRPLPWIRIGVFLMPVVHAPWLLSSASWWLAEALQRAGSEPEESYRTTYFALLGAKLIVLYVLYLGLLRGARHRRLASVLMLFVLAEFVSFIWMLWAGWHPEEAVSSGQVIRHGIAALLALATVTVFGSRSP
jgi:hypothetical protein